MWLNRDRKGPYRYCNLSQRIIFSIAGMDHFACTNAWLYTPNLQLPESWQEMQVEQLHFMRLYCRYNITYYIITYMLYYKNTV